jgi:hypothetical protein
VPNFKSIATKYSAYNIRVFDKKEKDAIFVTYNISNGVGIVKQELDDVLPVQ